MVYLLFIYFSVAWVVFISRESCKTNKKKKPSSKSKIYVIFPVVWLGVLASSGPPALSLKPLR